MVNSFSRTITTYILHKYRVTYIFLKEWIFLVSKMIWNSHYNHEFRRGSKWYYSAGSEKDEYYSQAGARPNLKDPQLIAKYNFHFVLLLCALNKFSLPTKCEVFVGL